MIKEKNIGIQTLRGILIIFVVFIYSLSISTNDIENYLLIIFRSLSNVAVPFFLFLSGYYFNKNKINDKNYFKKRLEKLLIPLIIYNILYFIYYSMINGTLNFKSFLLFSSGAQLYYLIVLIQLILIFKYLDKKVFEKIFTFINIIYLFIYYILWIKLDVIIPLHQYYFFAWYIYFLLGTKYQVKKKEVRTSDLFITIAIFISVVLWNIFILKKVGIEYSFSQMNIINMLFCINIFKYIGYFENLKSNIKILNIIGNNSFGIYLIHLFFIPIINKIFTFIYINSIFKTILCTILTLFISLIFINIIKKITKNRFNKILGI